MNRCKLIKNENLLKIQKWRHFDEVKSLSNMHQTGETISMNIKKAINHNFDGAIWMAFKNRYKIAFFSVGFSHLFSCNWIEIRMLALQKAKISIYPDNIQIEMVQPWFASNMDEIFQPHTHIHHLNYFPRNFWFLKSVRRCVSVCFEKSKCSSVPVDFSSTLFYLHSSCKTAKRQFLFFCAACIVERRRISRSRKVNRSLEMATERDEESQNIATKHIQNTQTHTAWTFRCWDCYLLKVLLSDPVCMRCKWNSVKNKQLSTCRWTESKENYSLKINSTSIQCQQISNACTHIAADDN